MIIENKRKTGIEFQDLSVGDVFVGYNDYLYLKIQETESNNNAVNLNNNRVTGFGEECIVYPVNAKLITIS